MSGYAIDLKACSLHHLRDYAAYQADLCHAKGDTDGWSAWSAVYLEKVQQLESYAAKLRAIQEAACQNTTPTDTLNGGETISTSASGSGEGCASRDAQTTP